MDHSATSDYMAHGFCFLWDPKLVWLHVISDAATGIAYFSIPIAMGYFIYKRRDLPFTYIFVFFALFIFACGGTHFFAAYTIFVPQYWPEGYLKAFTALISIVAAFLFIPMIPKAIVLPSLPKALESIKHLNAELTVQVEALRASEERYRTILQTTMDGFLMIDMEGRLLEVNDVYSRMSGYSVGELLTLRVPDLEDAETGNDTADHLRMLMEQGKDRFETRHRRKDGSIFDVEVTVQYRPFEGGRCVAFLKDITERKRAAATLKTERDRFQAILDMTPVMIAYKSKDDHFVNVNAAFAEFVGLPKEKIIGMTTFDLVKQQTVARQGRNHDLEVMRTGKPVLNQIIKWSGPRGGKEIWTIYSKMPFYDSEGTITGTISFVADIDERKRAEDALRESEDKYRSLFNNAAIGMFRTSLDGSKFLDMNEKFLDIFGQTREAMQGSTPLSHWAELKEREEMVSRLAQTGRVTDFECKMLDKQGNIRTCLTSLRLYKELQILEGSILDITDRKRAEDALRENQARLDFALHSAHMGVWRWDIKENKRYYNDLTCQLLGINAATFTGKPEEFFGVIHPDDKEKVKASLARAMEQEVPYDATYRVIWPEGSIHYISSRSKLLRDESGQPARFDGILWDVTAQHIFEEELLNKERKYRLLFESANDGIFILNETGFLDCNKKGAEMYGRAKGALLGSSPQEFAPEHQPGGRRSSELADEKVRAALNGIPQFFEWQALRADGSPFDVEIALSRLEFGGKMSLQAIVRDISERKRLEQEHLKTQKLESIGTLAGGIAHDFNNLLQGIFGYIFLAKLKKDDREKSMAALEEAEKALHLSIKLTNQLLTFSKGGKPIKQPIDLRPVIENAAKFALSGSRNDYHIAVHDSLWQVDADEGQIGQVIQNIVLNADQAMPKGGQVEITARNMRFGPDVPHGLESGNYVEIAIRDTGIGIPEGYVSKIFDPYFTTKERGSGLGLATSYSIIKNHGGIIDVKTKSGEGTTFVIFLPAISHAVRTASGQKDEDAPVPSRRARILVMDDEEVIRNLGRALLGELGHDVEVVKHGQEAVEAYQNAMTAGRPFDMVILDLTIRGGVGGVETVQQLLKMDPNVKAVVSSGYSDDASTANYLSQGFKASLKKPYDVKALRAVLIKLLDS